jgi:hypothetical protein
MSILGLLARHRVDRLETPAAGYALWDEDSTAS